MTAHINSCTQPFGLTGCSDTEKEQIYGTDGEVAFHSDFIRKKGLLTLPDFADFVNPSSYDGVYELSVSNLVICRNFLDRQIKAYNGSDETTEPPHISIYSKDDVKVGVENDLICHVTGFFPPPVIISWTKNSVNVTEFMNGQYRPNHDSTFNIFSHLKITPKEGDIYSCTVRHKAILGQTQTKTWGESLFSCEFHGVIIFHSREVAVYKA
ncbi:RLA class II histocompatibility antigen, DP alpha-1 chain-like [Labeo rohita]|uniref:RLA class II histocompatibility antigen, DP alpha-1 chain-like n=1 Tax=Labeo rohita TaxID=84645 RepID=UPI0021E33296|nr:RLA class II histocompatibility antigen, DP alpha-1 chain-like [Labeo rohita]